MTLFHRRACACPVASFAPGVAMKCWRPLTKSQAKLEMAYLRVAKEARCRLLEVMPIPQFPCTQPRSQASSAIRRKSSCAQSSRTGIKQQGEGLEQFGPQHRPSSNAEVVRRRERYVVLIRDGNLEGVIDRVELASRIAAGEL